MLSLTINRSALLEALSAPARVIERRNTIPVLSNVLLRAEAGHLTVTGTDLDMHLATRVSADIKVEGAITLPAGALLDFVRKLPADASVAVEEGSNGQATVRSGRSRFTLGSLPAVDFPDWLTVGDSPSLALTLPGSTLDTLLSRCAFAISNEETRYYLNGTYLSAVETDAGLALRAVTTDGHRLARIDTTAVEGLRLGVPGVIVPRKACEEIRKLADAAGEGEVRLSFNAHRVQFGVGNTEYISKVIDGTFPDYARVIPLANDKVALAAVAALRDAVARVGTIASERGRAVKLMLHDAGLTITMRNPDAGEAVETIDVEYEGEPFDIGLNGRFLSDILDQVDADTTRIELDTPGSPVLFRARRDGDALFVLMPMRV